MRYDGSIRINTLLNTLGLRRGEGEIRGSMNRISSSAKKMATVIASAFAVGKVAQFGKEALDAASDFEAMESQFSQVFGELEDVAGKSLSNVAGQAGIMEDRMKSSFTRIAAFAKTTGMDTASSLKLSERAMVAVADSAAFYDRSLEETTEYLQSFLKGNYENDAALGLSATEFTRNAAANKLYGKSFIKLSEAQKQLTLLQMVEDANALSGALGQAAREADTWTNQTGNLSQAWTNLKAGLGRLVLPIAVQAVKSITNVINALNAMISKLSVAAGAFRSFSELLTGKKSSSGSGVPESGMADAAEGYSSAAGAAENLADSTEDVAKATKDAKKAAEGYLSPLDEISRYKKEDSDSAGGSAGAGSGMGGGIGDVDYGNLAEGETIIDNINSKLLEMWDKADFTEFGTLFGTKLKNALESIPWVKLQSVAAKVGKSFATLINGAIEVDGLGKSIGKTVAQAINIGISGIDAFAGRLHWDSVGKFIGDGVNGAIENINWGKAFSAAKNIGLGIASAINGFMKVSDFKGIGSTVANYMNTSILFSLSFGKKLDFGKIGKKIADGINGFFNTLKVKELADSISTWVKGALKTVSKLLKETDFELIGEKIGVFLSSIDLKGAMKELGSLIWETIKGAFSLLSSFFKTAPLEASLVTAFALFKFTGVTQTFSANLLNALKSGTSSSLSAFTSYFNGGLAGAITAGVASFAEFSVVSDSMENLTKGTEDFVSEIGRISGAVAAAGVAMTAVLGFPTGIIATSIVGVVGAIAGVTGAMDEMERKAAEEAEITRYGQTIASMTEKLRENAESIKERIEQSREYIDSAGVGEAQMAKDLSDRYFELAGKQKKTNEEMDEMKRIAGILIEQMPDLNQYYNEQTGLLDTTKQNVENLIQSRLKEIKLNAMEEELTQAYKDQSAALGDLKKAADLVNDAQKTMNELQGELKKATDRMDLYKKYEELGRELENCTGETSELAKEQQDLWKELTNGGREFIDLNTLETEISNAEQAIGDFRGQYDTVMKSFAEYKSAYDAVGKQISDLTEMYMDGMANVAKNGVDGYTNWINSRNAQKPVEDANIELAKKAYESFNKGQDAHSPSKKFGEAAKYSVDGYVQGISNNKKNVLSTIGTFVNDILGKFNGIGERFSPKGKEIISGIATGIKDKWSNFFADWSYKKESIVEEYKDMQDRFNAKGKNIISGISNGIKEKWNDFIKDWADKKDSIASTFSNLKDTMADIGKGIVNGIIEGISSVWSTLVGWANSIKDLFSIRPSASAAGVSMVGGASPRAVSYPRLMAPIPEIPIPALATGAVIPPNREFLAVLGDQKHGTNIEAPLSTIEQAVENVMKRNSFGRDTAGTGNIIHNQVQINRRVLLDEMIEEAKLRHTVSGISPFSLA